MTVETFTTNASGKTSIRKDPDAVLDYTINLTDWLSAASDPADTLKTGTTATVSGSETANVDSVAFTDTHITAWISGAVAGEEIALTFHWVTVGGRTDERTVYLKVKER